MYDGYRLPDEYDDALKMSVVEDARLTEPNWTAVVLERVVHLLDDEDMFFSEPFAVWILAPRTSALGAGPDRASVNGFAGAQSDSWKAAVESSQAWATLAPTATHLYVDRAT